MQNFAHHTPIVFRIGFVLRSRWIFVFSAIICLLHMTCASLLADSEISSDGSRVTMKSSTYVDKSSRISELFLLSSLLDDAYDISTGVIDEHEDVKHLARAVGAVERQLSVINAQLSSVHEFLKIVETISKNLIESRDVAFRESLDDAYQRVMVDLNEVISAEYNKL